jgi:hypothetical protein
MWRIMKPAILIGLVCLMLSVGGVMLLKQRHATKPLGERPSLNFPSEVSQSMKVKLLMDDFSTINSVSALPPAVLETFREKGGSRAVLVDPGAHFNPRDVISDASVPRKRLILAGVSKDKCFVHYEQGGIGLFNVIDVFELGPEKELRPLWHGYCREPSRDLKKLRTQVADGGCS